MEYFSFNCNCFLRHSGGSDFAARFHLRLHFFATTAILSLNKLVCALVSLDWEWLGRWQRGKWWHIFFVVVFFFFCGRIARRRSTG